MQLIRYQGAPVALAGAERFYLAESVAALPDGDPVKRFVCWCCLYAREVLAGELPGPYTQADAERFARAALVPERMVRAAGQSPTHELAVRLRVTAEQVVARRIELGRRA